MKPDLYELLPDVVLFVAVAGAKSFSRAAKALGMPVSTLSRRIADFEGKLGIQLLVRSTRQVDLTEAGARYFERCQLVVEAAEAAQAELGGHVDNPRGSLRVSVTQDFALTYLTAIFADFTSRYPDVSFELDLTPRSVDLIGEGFDVAIRMGPLPDSQLFARRIGTSPIALYAAPGYLKRAGLPKVPADLAAHQCLRILGPVDGEARWTLERGEQVESVRVKGKWVAYSMRFLLELATRGLGVIAIDRAVARPAVESGALVQILPEWSPPPVPVHAITPSKLLPARTRVFLDCLGDHIRMEGPDARSGEARATPRGAAQPGRRLRG
jgi:DNA-binding transcriptional LysR family regulator